MRRLLPHLAILAPPLAALLALLTLGISAPVAQQRAWGSPVGPLHAGNRVGQSFRIDPPFPSHPARRPLLLRELEVRIGTYHRRVEDELELRLYRAFSELREPHLPEPIAALRRIRRETASLKDNHPFRFDLQSLPVRIGEAYYLELASLRGRPGQELALWTTGTDTYPGGSLLREGRAIPGDLTFRVLIRLKGLDLARLWLDEATWWKPRGADRPAVLVTLLAALLAAAAALGGALWKEPR